MQPRSQQRTLFNLTSVVVLGSSGSCFTHADIRSLRHTLLTESRPASEILSDLRKLDCYQLSAADLQATEVGGAVATLAACHPRPQVAALARSVTDKWQQQVARELFPRLPFDRDLAAAAPEGRPVAAQQALAELRRARKEAARAARVAEAVEGGDAAACLWTSSDEEEEADEGRRDGDADWRPRGMGGRARSEGGRARSEGNLDVWSNSTTGVEAPGGESLAAKYAPDSAFRKTRAGAKVPLDAALSCDGRMYRQGTLLGVAGREKRAREGEEAAGDAMQAHRGEEGAGAREIQAVAGGVEAATREVEAATREVEAATREIKVVTREIKAATQEASLAPPPRVQGTSAVDLAACSSQPTPIHAYRQTSISWTRPGLAQVSKAPRVQESGSAALREAGSCGGSGPALEAAAEDLAATPLHPTCRPSLELDPASGEVIDLASPGEALDWEQARAEASGCL